MPFVNVRQITELDIILSEDDFKALALFIKGYGDEPSSDLAEWSCGAGFSLWKKAVAILEAAERQMPEDEG